jgi:uncharacterized protein
MPLDVAGLLPPEVSLPIAVLLMVFSFFTSALTATFGLGGGIIMLAGLGLVFSPAVLLPVHGFVQFGSNVGRAIVQRQFIHWQTALWFALGAIPGVLIGAQIALSLPETLFTVLIAAFVLYSTWGPQPALTARGPMANFIGGAVISGIGMLIGAIGLLVANFIKWLPDRRMIIATQAMVVTFSNGLKVVAFAMFGVALGAYIPLIVAMIVTGFIGTMVGSRLLERMPERGFRTGFKVALTLIALELLRGALL